MTIDFHVHGKITSKYSFNKEDFLLTINEAKENGLDAIALTEHCHATNFLEGYQFLKNNYELIEDYFDINGFKVFYGIEVTTKEKIDILIIGNPKNIIELRDNIITNLSDDEFIKINKLFEIPILKELLIILAHPYRRYGQFPHIRKEIIDKIDAIEFNAKDLHQNGIETMKNKVLELAKNINLPVIAGSDTHYFIQISSIKNIFSNECNNIIKIKEEIKLKNYKTEESSELNIRVKSASIIKKLICNK